MHHAGHDPTDFQIVGDDPLLRMARRLRLAPADGLGVVRRATLLALVAWVPLLIGAALERRLLGGPGQEPVLALFQVHAQCLLGIPLFVAGETVAKNIGRLFEQSVQRNGLVAADQIDAFDELVAQHVRLRRWTVPWAAIAAMVLLALAASAGLQNHPGLIVHGRDLARGIGFTGTWYLCVSRPIFQALLLGWLWKIVLWGILMARLSRLRLQLVPAHPDRLMGLGFLERLPTAFTPFILGVSLVAAASAAHDIVYHGADIKKFFLMFATFGVIVALIVLGPLLAFMNPLLRAKRQALIDYGALSAEHHRLVHERWTEGKEPVDRSVLEAPELGPAADVETLYYAVAATRAIPIGRIGLLAVLVPVALPILLVATLQIPIPTMLLRIVNALL